jgi:hypothetical protein
MAMVVLMVRVMVMDRSFIMDNIKVMVNRLRGMVEALVMVKRMVKWMVRLKTKKQMIYLRRSYEYFRPD